MITRSTVRESPGRKRELFQPQGRLYGVRMRRKSIYGFGNGGRVYGRFRKSPRARGTVGKLPFNVGEIITARERYARVHADSRNILFSPPPGSKPRAIVPRRGTSTISNLLMDMCGNCSYSVAIIQRG